MRMLREAWAESNPAHCNERRRGKTRRGETKHGFCVNRGFELKPNHVCKQRLKPKMKSATRMMQGERGGRGGWVQVRRCKNPRQGEGLDKDQRQNKQYNYEQARSTRHAGRPADLSMFTCFSCIFHSFYFFVISTLSVYFVLFFAVSSIDLQITYFEFFQHGWTSPNPRARPRAWWAC